MIIDRRSTSVRARRNRKAGEPNCGVKGNNTSSAAEGIGRRTTAVDRRRIRTATRARAALSTAGRRAAASRRNARAPPPSGPRPPKAVVGARRRTTDCYPCRQSPPTDVANVAELRRLSNNNHTRTRVDMII